MWLWSLALNADVAIIVYHVGETIKKQNDHNA
jgi:hypothetical protein